MPKITPFLMFEGDAEAALNLYLSLFRPSELLSLSRHGPQSGAEGKVEHALLSLKGQLLRCMDSSIAHGFTFTPSLSFFVTCDDEAEIERLHAGLSAGGETLMPLESYPFARKFAWVNDRYGVSWQLSLA